MSRFFLRKIEYKKQDEEMMKDHGKTFGKKKSYKLNYIIQHIPKELVNFLKQKS